MSRPHHVAPPMHTAGMSGSATEIRNFGSGSGMASARPMQVGGMMHVGLPKPALIPQANNNAGMMMRVGIPRPQGTTTSGVANTNQDVVRIGIPKAGAADAVVARPADAAIPKSCCSHHVDKAPCGGDCRCGSNCPCKAQHEANTRVHLAVMPFAKTPDIVIDLYAGSHVPTVIINKRHPHWQEDDSTYSCTACYAPFTFLFRRHHCRGCGAVLCSKCCFKRPAQAEPWCNHRVCNKCDQRITTFAQRLKPFNAPPVPR